MVLLKIRLYASLVAVYAFMVPRDKMLRNVPCWFYRIVLKSIRVQLDNALPSLVVAFIFHYSLNVEVRLRLCLAYYHF